jgi:hypothetical protein
MGGGVDDVTDPAAKAGSVLRSRNRAPRAKDFDIRHSVRIG